MYSQHYRTIYLHAGPLFDKVAREAGYLVGAERHVAGLAGPRLHPVHLCAAPHVMRMVGTVVQHSSVRHNGTSSFFFEVQLL